MNEKLNKILEVIINYMQNKKNCQIRINLHEGNLSDKLEIKESLKIE